jgi:hypothetical protein
MVQLIAIHGFCFLIKDPIPFFFFCCCWAKLNLFEVTAAGHTPRGCCWAYHTWALLVLLLTSLGTVCVAGVAVGPSVTRLF